MADNQKSLSEIMFEITRIQEKLFYGEIDYTYDKLFSALGAGSPAEMLDGIISDVFWDVRSNKKPSREAVVKMTEQLEAFKDELQIKQLKTPIGHLHTLLKTYQDIYQTGEEEVDIHIEKAVDIANESVYVSKDGPFELKKTVSDVCDELVAIISSPWIHDKTTIDEFYTCMYVCIYVGIVVNAVSRAQADKQSVVEYVCSELNKDGCYECAYKAIGVISENEKQQFGELLQNIVGYILYVDGITDDNFDNKIKTVLERAKTYCKATFFVGAIMELQTNG